MTTKKPRDLYEILGVPKDASKIQIHHSWLDISFNYFSIQKPKKYETKKFVEAGRAWKTLAYLDTKEAYDKGELSVGEILKQEFGKNEVEDYKASRFLLRKSF